MTSCLPRFSTSWPTNLFHLIWKASSLLWWGGVTLEESHWPSLPSCPGHGLKKPFSWEVKHLQAPENETVYSCLVLCVWPLTLLMWLQSIKDLAHWSHGGFFTHQLYIRARVTFHFLKHTGWWWTRTVQWTHTPASIKTSNGWWTDTGDILLVIMKRSPPPPPRFVCCDTTSVMHSSDVQSSHTRNTSKSFMMKKYLNIKVAFMNTTGAWKYLLLHVLLLTQ